MYLSGYLELAETVQDAGYAFPHQESAEPPEG